MNTTPTPGNGRPGNGHTGNGHPADLAALQATDALLDRLARGGATPADREDPLVESLLALRTSLDDPGEAGESQDVSRLIEVLGERPLYLVDYAGAEATAEDQPVWLGAGESDVVVDLRERAESGPATAPSGVRRPTGAGSAGDRDGVDGDTDGVDGDRDGADGAAAQVVELPAARWQRAMRHAGMPAASMLLLLALGSGVSAAVTGNPMAPVTGVSRVVSQLPGGQQKESTAATIASANQDIMLAGRAAREHDQARAATLLAVAQKKLAQLPPAEKQQLQAQITAVKQVLASPTVPALPTPDDPGVVVVSTPPTQATTPPDTTPPDTPSPTEPASTTTPPESPSPTPTPTPSASDTTTTTSSAAAEETAQP